jgi:hypothetical protein
MAFIKRHWWFYMLLQSAGFGGAGVSPAVLCWEGKARIAGETPAPPNPPAVFQI